jgi:3-polyprenyl-4-hydroxybenzoate decarboxylase
MACNDRRSFLKLLDVNNQLVQISEPVWPEPDIAAAADVANGT